MEDDVLKLKEVVSVTFDTTPFFLDMASLIANSVNLPTKFSEFTNQIQ